MSTRGIDIRQGNGQIVFRTSLKDSAGAKITTGTTELRVLRLEDDGTLDVYDWTTNDFVAAGAGTPDDETTMTHIQRRDSTGADVDTGLWTKVLSTLTNWTAGQVYIAQVTNSGATPESQEREFQFSGVEGTQTTTNTHTWHVAKTGSDSNSGHSFDTALLTIGAAVTAAASGDCIIVYPGDYVEAVNLNIANKSIELQGTNRALCRIAPTTGIGVEVEDNCILRNLSILAIGNIGDTDTRFNKGVYADAKNDLLIEDCNICGSYDGVTLTGSRHTLRNCHISGMYDGGNVNVEGFVISDCVWESLGTYDTFWTQTTPSRGAIFTKTGTAINSTFVANRTDVTAQTVAGVQIWGTSDVSVVFNGCAFKAASTNAGASGAAYGIEVNGTAAQVVVIGGSAEASEAGSGSTADLKVSAGSLTTCGVAYSSTSGTITYVQTNVVQISGDATAADNAELAFDTTGYGFTNCTMPTVTTVTNQLTAAAIATGVWQDATAGDFITASSIGKALYTGNFAPGAAGGLLIAGSNAATTFATMTLTSGTIPVDLQTIKTQTITCGAAVTVLASVGTAATSTAQTGDVYALANGASGFAALDAAIAAVPTAAEIVTQFGTGSTLTACLTATGFSTHTAANVVTALEAATSYIQIRSWCLGNWADSGVAGKYNVLDPDDGVTVRMTVIPAETTPYKTMDLTP